MADLLVKIEATGLTGLTARTLTLLDEVFSDAAPLTEIGGSGVYRATIADDFDLALVYDSVGTAIAQAESIATALSAYTVPTLAQVQAAGFADSDRTALTGLVTTVGVAGAGLTEAGGTGDQLTDIPTPSSPVPANVTQVAGSNVAGVSAFHADVDGALTSYGAAKASDLKVTVSGGFTSTYQDALTGVDVRVEKLFKRQGLIDGITATVKSAEAGSPGFLVTSDGDIDQVMTKNPDGSVTISNA